MDKQFTIIEVNGVKLEVDLRTARRIDTLRIGSRVKCLVKEFSDHKTYAGIVVGFEPFEKLPTVIVAYLNSSYASCDLIIRSFNSETKDFEMVADLDNNSLEVSKSDVLAKMLREENKAQLAVDEIRQKREFFLRNFGSYFVDLQNLTEPTQ